MPLVTTGIGSLPLAEMAPANLHIAANYSLVFVPQLARGEGDGGMLNLVLPPGLSRRALSGFGVALTDFLEGPEISNAFSAIETVSDTIAVRDALEFAALRDGESPLPRLKAQMMGPVSLLQTLRDAGSRPLWSDPSLHEAVLAWSVTLAQELSGILKPLCASFELWIDEPMLGLMIAPDERRTASRLLRAWQDAMIADGVETGLHCCSEPPFDLLDALAPGTFSFDILRFDAATREHFEELSHFVDRGGRAALGVIAPLAFDVDPDPTPFVNEIAAALRLDTPAKIIRALVLTPTCGTMLTPLDREEEIAGSLRKWSEALAETPEES